MGKTESICSLSDLSEFYGKDMATRDAYGITLVELGKKNPDIVVLDADLSCSTKTAKFAKLFPDRFFNMGISEQDMIGTAAGLALTGKIPFASTFAIFATGRAWEQIRQTVCYSNANVKVVATHGGITVGEDGATHQALEDIALMRVIPGMSVIVPSDAYETAQSIVKASEYYGPVYIRLGRAKVQAVMPEDYRFQIGKAYIFRIGKDANIVANGLMVSEALKAAEVLRKDGIDTGVANFSSVKPLDEDALFKTAKASKLVITAEEHSIIGGLGSAVSEFLAENHPVAIKRIGISDSFGCSGPSKELLKFYGLTAENIVKIVKEFFKK
ncbi:MAG TPA: transketolase family protein [Thermodesulfovibrio thiophilus]|uniref:transketolase family protein n=1 Tax=Thermodesulfovibrio thiophilus TaxID=340095 RepID=UPI00040FB704|nr:transketolase family protein [Thermodesulfovibrio thiophilus]HOA82947.1 transketolase family protein [Thermodesulfovibrio thiophilus]HQA04027.1 transketolase family protein [Thermodesulfovibrio thiophilus]HQD35637.1 transketolase family protein [Thermodesulfovibrio thiophilus]